MHAWTPVEALRWGQIPHSESLLHATAARLRSNGNRWASRTPPITPPLCAGGVSWAGGGRTHTTSLPRILRRKSQGSAPAVLRRRFSTQACCSRAFGERPRRRARPLQHLPPATEALPRRDEKHSLNGAQLVSSLVSFGLVVCRPLPLGFTLPLILWNNRLFGNARKNQVQPR